MSSFISNEVPPTPDPAEARARSRRGRWQALAILAICAAPVVLGTIAFRMWQSAGQTNYGELLVATAIELVGSDEQVTVNALGGSAGMWRIVIFDSGTCEEMCQRKLLHSRQVRLATGRDQDRVQRIWMIDDANSPVASLADLHRDARILRVTAATRSDVFGPPAELRRFIYLIDPGGYLVMRYPGDPDPKRMLKDLQRLLKYTQVRPASK